METLIWLLGPVGVSLGLIVTVISAQHLGVDPSYRCGQIIGLVLIPALLAAWLAPRIWKKQSPRSLATAGFGLVVLLGSFWGVFAAYKAEAERNEVRHFLNGIADLGNAYGAGEQLSQADLHLESYGKYAVLMRISYRYIDRSNRAFLDYKQAVDKVKAINVLSLDTVTHPDKIKAAMNALHELADVIRHSSAEVRAAVETLNAEAAAVPGTLSFSQGFFTGMKKSSADGLKWSADYFSNEQALLENLEATLDFVDSRRGLFVVSQSKILFKDPQDLIAFDRLSKRFEELSGREKDLLAQQAQARKDFVKRMTDAVRLLDQ